MTAITDFSTQTPLSEASYMMEGAGWVTRGAQRFGGLALVLAAVGLWYAPAAPWDADIALFKLGVSGLVGVAGLAMMQGGHRQPSVEIEIDTERREVRLVRGTGRKRSVISRTAIRDLGPAEIHGDMARLWTAEGALVADVAVTDPDVRCSLTAALREAGKL